MSKFELQLKVQGLEFHVRGDRADAPLVAQQIGQGVAAVIQPTLTAALADDNPAAKLLSATEETRPPAQSTTVAPARAPRRRRSAASTAAATTTAVAWKHDPSKWGLPQQKWPAWQRALWWIFVAVNETGTKEFTTTQIAVSFNANFRESGRLDTGHIIRDLGKQKSLGVVGQDPNTLAWYLTDAGNKTCAQYVAEAKAAIATVTGEGQAN